MGFPRETFSRDVDRSDFYGRVKLNSEANRRIAGESDHREERNRSRALRGRGAAQDGQAQQYHSADQWFAECCEHFEMPLRAQN